MTINIMSTNSSPGSAQISRIVALLWEKNVSHLELAEMFGVNKSTISRKINGPTKWTTEEISIIAKRLGTNILYLMDMTDDPRPLEEIMPGQFREPDINEIVGRAGLEPATKGL